MNNIFEFKLSDKRLWYELYELTPKGGVYILYIYFDNKPKVIGRLLGSDSEGILYIGKCECFTDRVIELKKTISEDYNTNTHICGRRLKKIKINKEKLPYKNMRIQIIPYDNPDKLEDEKIENYFQNFGEVPPLNALN